MDPQIRVYSQWDDCQDLITHKTVLRLGATPKSCTREQSNCRFTASVNFSIRFAFVKYNS